MGGYVSAPSCLIAKLFNIPVIIHEQNCIMGLTNRILSLFSRCILHGFPSIFSKRSIFIGNPVRREILNLPIPRKRFKNKKGPIRILILGGSQGSEIINNTLPRVVSKIKKDILIIHQTGKNKKISTESLYYKLCSKNIYVKYKIVDFIHEIDKAYFWSDIVICRSGALTVSEILVIGLAAIFIPYPHKDKHQYKNALFLKKIGAAEIYEESMFLEYSLKKFLLHFSRSHFFKMSKIARKRLIFNPVKRIERILNIFSK